MTEAQILLALHQGVYNATKEYEYWSGGILLHECAGESFMVSHMATSAILVALLNFLEVHNA